MAVKNIIGKKEKQEQRKRRRNISEDLNSIIIRHLMGKTISKVILGAKKYGDVIVVDDIQPIAQVSES